MNREWVTTTIDSLKSNKENAIAIGPFGSRMKSNCYVDKGIPVIRGNNIGSEKSFVGEFVYVTEEKSKELSSSLTTRDDLVFPHRGAIGRVGIVDSDETMVISSSLMKLTCDKEKVSPLFVFYYFRSPQGVHQLLKNASTVGTPGIGQPLSSLKSIECPIPPLQEQKAIAHILGTLDDKIELNRRTSETLEGIARAIFKSWFVNFAPVRAKAEGRPTGLPREISDLFPDSFEDSELGEVPKGWQLGDLSSLATLNPESWGNSNHPSNLRYLDLSNVKFGKISKIEEYTWNDAPSRARRILRNADTIVGTVRPGNGSYCLIPEDGLTGSTGFAVLRPKHLSAREYVYLAATNSINIERLANLSDGGAYPAVRPEVVLATPSWLFSDSILKAFSDLLLPVYNLILMNEIEAVCLSSLRDTLLPKLISGELRIPDAEAFVAEAGV